MADEQKTDETTEEVVETPVEETNTEVENTEVEEAETEPKEEEDKDLDYWKNEADKWKKNSRKNEDTSKTNFSRIKELELEVENYKKASDELNAIKEENKNLLRKTVAAEYGIPEALATRLVGETEEELKADAELVSGSFGNVKNAPKTPKPIMSQGTDTNSNDGVIRSGKDYERLFKQK